jgi:hypothetical protein
MANSQRFELNSTDLKKIGTGAIIAILGALLTYGTETIGNVELGQWTPIVVAVFSIIANTIRKFIVDNSK